MTNYITATDVARTLRGVTLPAGRSAVSMEWLEIVTRFAFGFYPDSFEARSDFIRQCVPEYCEWCRDEGYIRNPDDLKLVPCGCRKTQPTVESGELSFGEELAGLEFEVVPAGEFDNVPPSEFETVPGITREPQTLPMPPVDTSALRLGIMATIEQAESPKCCYLRPSPNCPHGDYRRPCTADAVWVIQERGAPEYEKTYACDVHLPYLLSALDGHKYNRYSYTFTIWPLKVALPELDPEDYDSEAEPLYTPDDDDDDAFGILDHEELPVQDRTGPGNDPVLDVDKEYADMLKRFMAERCSKPSPWRSPTWRRRFERLEQLREGERLDEEMHKTPDPLPDDFLTGIRRGVDDLNKGKITPWEEVEEELGLEESHVHRPLPPGGMWARSEDQLFKIVRTDSGQLEYIPVGELNDEPDDDLPAGTYLRGGVLYKVMKLWGLTYSFPVDERGNALDPVDDPRGAIKDAYIARDIQLEPDRCAVCGIPDTNTRLDLCLGCGELTCNLCMIYAIEHEDSYEHEIEDHLRYEECHGTKEEPNPYVVGADGVVYLRGAASKELTEVD